MLKGLRSTVVPVPDLGAGHASVYGSADRITGVRATFAAIGACWHPGIGYSHEIGLLGGLAVGAREVPKNDPEEPSETTMTQMQLMEARAYYRFRTGSGEVEAGIRSPLFWFDDDGLFAGEIPTQMYLGVGI